jgi:hypothetical protein
MLVFLCKSIWNAKEIGMEPKIPPAIAAHEGQKEPVIQLTLLWLNNNTYFL